MNKARMFDFPDGAVLKTWGALSPMGYSFSTPARRLIHIIIAIPWFILWAFIVTPPILILWISGSVSVSAMDYLKGK